MQQIALINIKAISKKKQKASINYSSITLNYHSFLAFYETFNV